MSNSEQVEGQGGELEETPEFIAWAKTRMKEMKQAAEDATKALGLPRERSFDVMRVMFSGHQPHGISEGQYPNNQPTKEPGDMP